MTLVMSCQLSVVSLRDNHYGSRATRNPQKSAETPYQKPQANKPYRTEEVFEVFKVAA